MKYYLQKSLFILLFVSVFAACQHKHPKAEVANMSPYFNAFISENETHVLRNIDFNLTPDEVKKRETCKLYDETSDHLFYEFSFPTDSTTFSEYADIQYFFNENNLLDIISAGIYVNDSIQEKKLMENLTDYFNLRYGKQHETQDGDKVWQGDAKNKTNHEHYSYSVSLKKLEDDEHGVQLEFVKN